MIRLLRIDLINIFLWWYGMEKIRGFLKKEIVLVVATVFAVISCFFVPLDKEYIAELSIVFNKNVNLSNVEEFENNELQEVSNLSIVLLLKDEVSKRKWRNCFLYNC